jgi:muconolactone delta-isomerase
MNNEWPEDKEGLSMEYLVTMTTQVPDGTSGAAVGDIRAREAARSRELAAQRHLLRLWRPPLEPGEWRTLGLFAAADGAELESVLTSMPLRIWRTDEVTPLSPHPNDPAPNDPAPNDPAPGAGPPGAPAAGDERVEFLTTFTIHIPEGTPAVAVADTEAREAERARELAGEGHLERLWKLPGQGRTLGLWRADDSAAMQAILASLPLDAWMSVQTTPLSPHPSDPALTGNQGTQP